MPARRRATLSWFWRNVRRKAFGLVDGLLRLGRRSSCSRQLRRRSRGPRIWCICQDRLHFVCLDRLVLEQRVDHTLHFGPVGFQNAARVLVAVVDDLTNLPVDLARDFFGIVAIFTEIAAEEHLVIPATVL